MLRSKNLDNQSFDEIMEYVTDRLPWLCPPWTDYNAHDPGITILELIAWYKEMQQFHLNTITAKMRKKLLELVGVTLRPASPATCYVDLPPGSPRAAFSRLETGEGIPFELIDEAGAGADLNAVYVVDEARAQDVTELLKQPQLSVAPFSGGDGELWLGFKGSPSGELKLFFEVDSGQGIPRNPFEGPYMPRVIVWEFVGSGHAVVTSDETHALSQSGHVRLSIPEHWPEYKSGHDIKSLRYVRLRLVDPGCEERVCLRAVHANRYKAEQRETWSYMSRYTIPGDEARIMLTDEVSLSGELFAFVRDGQGLRQAPVSVEFSEYGRMVTIDMSGASHDGAENLFLVKAAALHERDLFYNSTGLPDMTVILPLYGRKLLTDRIQLICDTRCADGVVRPEIWRYTDDLGVCGPSERVFTVDAERESLVFGDGEHGAVVVSGDNAILLAQAAVSYCESGNIPEGQLVFDSDGLVVENTAASGGTDSESVEQATRLFLRKLESPRKCASAGDYERIAMATPGLRIAAAKAIAGYDPEEPTGRSALPVVTVVVVPVSHVEQPIPDARFMEAVRVNLSKRRPICTKVKVVAPRYVPVGLSVKVRANGSDAIEHMKRSANDYFTPGERRGIGDGVIAGDLIARLSKIDGILHVERLELYRLGPDCRTTPSGDILVPPGAIAYLAAIDVDRR